MSTKHLVRKCACGNTIAVKVSGDSVLVYPSLRNGIVWKDIEILNDSGYLNKRFHSRRYLRRQRRWVYSAYIKDLSHMNRVGYKAVFCRCGSINHLSKFVEVKL